MALGEQYPKPKRGRVYATVLPQKIMSMEENQISTNDTLMEWLMENGGPVIRYRSVRELLESNTTVNQLAGELIRSQIMRTWLERLGPPRKPSDLHSSKVTAYENAMGKLIQLGCHCGVTPFDEHTETFRTRLLPGTTSSEFTWTPFMRMIVGSFLVLAGYHQETAVQEYIEHRLDTLWRFAREKDFDIYADRDQYPDIPQGFHDKPLVKLELYADGEEHFPTIYDIHALANYPDHLLSEDTQEKIDAVIEYILHPKYQAFPEGYGLMKAGKRKYHAVGWSVHLPRYQPSQEKGYHENRLIQRLVLMSNFRAARQHWWFQENINRLEEFCTAQGTYIFPRSYLQERASGYWVTSAYMGLEENRRKKITIELESTFWMMKIKKNDIRKE